LKGFKIKIQVNGLNVLGNKNEGFEINDILSSHGVISVASTNDFDVILALLENDIIFPGQYEIDFFGDKEYFANLIDKTTGKPFLQLREYSR